MTRLARRLGAGLLIGGLAGGAAADVPVDLIVHHARVYAGPGARAQAIAVRGDRVVALGSDAEMLRRRGPKTRVIDAGGRLVIPGINDAHVHWVMGSPGTFLELASMEPSLEEMLCALAAATKRARPGSFVFGSVGARVADEPRATRATLDAAAPQHPVVLRGWTGHGTFLNTAAMRRLGIPDDPPEVPGGRVGRDEHGRFNGWLFEYAERRVSDGPRKIESRETALQDIRDWAAEAAGFGITSLQVMPGLPVDEFTSLLRDAAFRLRARVIAFPAARDEPLRGAAGSDRIRVNGIKWILDGTPVERGAAVRVGYIDRPSSLGFLNFPENFVREALRRAAARGEQSLFHCAGDRCAETVLAAMESDHGSDWKARRVRIEHGDGVLPDLASRAARLGVVVVQNPTHFAIGDVLNARYGPSHGFMPLRSLIGSGIRIALGSDGPPNPFLNLQLAVTHPARPEEALTLDQALAAYTEGAAFAEHAEADKGTLAPGKLADLAVLSQDIFAIAPGELPATTSLLTIVGGEVVHDALTRAAIP